MFETKPWYSLFERAGAGAPGLEIDPVRVSGNVYFGGNYKDVDWDAVYVDNYNSLSLTFLDFDDAAGELTRAFSDAIGYEPFCRYRNQKTGATTVDWRQQGRDTFLKFLRNGSLYDEIVEL